MIVSARTMPASSAAAAVNGFSVEPGSNKIRHRAIARAVRIHLAAVVRVVGRQIREREDFTGLRVENDDAARLRPVIRHRLLQLPVREILDPGVDRERELRAVLRLTDALDVFDDVAAPVLEHAAAPGLARERRIECELERFLATCSSMSVNPIRCAITSPPG